MSNPLPVVTLTVLGTPTEFTWDEGKREFRPTNGGPAMPLDVALIGSAVGWLEGLDVGAASGCSEGCEMCGGVGE